MVKCVAILSDGSIFATLAFHEDSVLVAAGYRCLQIHPITAERAAETTGRLNFFAEAKNEMLQLTGKLLPLDRELTESFFKSILSTLSAAERKPSSPSLQISMSEVRIDVIDLVVMLISTSSLVCRAMRVL